MVEYKNEDELASKTEDKDEIDENDDNSSRLKVYPI